MWVCASVGTQGKPLSALYSLVHFSKRFHGLTEGSSMSLVQPRMKDPRDPGGRDVLAYLGRGKRTKKSPAMPRATSSTRPQLPAIAGMVSGLFRRKKVHGRRQKAGRFDHVPRPFEFPLKRYNWQCFTWSGRIGRMGSSTPLEFGPF
jgi:hypothetical protein